MVVADHEKSTAAEPLYQHAAGHRVSWLPDGPDAELQAPERIAVSPAKACGLTSHLAAEQVAGRQVR